MCTLSSLLVTKSRRSVIRGSYPLDFAGIKAGLVYFIQFLIRSILMESTFLTTHHATYYYRCCSTQQPPNNCWGAERPP